MASPVAAAGGVAAGMNPWLAGTLFALDTLGGGLGAGEQREMDQAGLAQRWQELLLNLAQRQSEQGDERGRTAAGIAQRQAMLPLMDQAFSGLQARFAQGPARFGQSGAQNSAAQAAAAGYQPGQNRSMAQYGADLELLKDRFMGTPTMGSDAYINQLAQNRGWSTDRERTPRRIVSMPSL